jgi:hypothetical protein
VASPEWIVERHLEAGSEQGRALIGYFDVTYDKDLFVHHLRVSSIDEGFAGWIRDACEQVGCGRR